MDVWPQCRRYDSDIKNFRGLALDTCTMRVGRCLCRHSMLLPLSRGWALSEGFGGTYRQLPNGITHRTGWIVFRATPQGCNSHRFVFSGNLVERAPSQSAHFLCINGRSCRHCVCRLVVPSAPQHPLDFVGSRRNEHRVLCFHRSGVCTFCGQTGAPRTFTARVEPSAGHKCIRRPCVLPLRPRRIHRSSVVMANRRQARLGCACHSRLGLAEHQQRVATILADGTSLLATLNANQCRGISESGVRRRQPRAGRRALLPVTRQGSGKSFCVAQEQFLIFKHLHDSL